MLGNIYSRDLQPLLHASCLTLRGKERFYLQSANIYVHRNDAKTYRLCPFLDRLRQRQQHIMLELLPSSSFQESCASKKRQKEKKETFCMRANMTSTCIAEKKSFRL